MIPRLPIMIGCLFLSAFAQEATEETTTREMETWFFPHVEWSAFMEDPFGSDFEPEKASTNFQALLARFGVEFPEGSSLRYERMLGGIVMKNTRENHVRLEHILNKTGVASEGVYIQVWALSFPEADLAALERKQGAPLKGDAVLSMWREGKGDVVFSQGVRGISGVNSVLEIGTADLKGAKGENHPFPALNVTPTVATNQHHINLTVLLDMDGAENAEKGLPNSKLATSLVVGSGDTVQIANTRLPDGRRVFVFVRAEVIPMPPVPFPKLNMIQMPGE